MFPMKLMMVGAKMDLSPLRNEQRCPKIAMPSTNLFDALFAGEARQIF